MARIRVLRRTSIGTVRIVGPPRIGRVIAITAIGAMIDATGATTAAATIATIGIVVTIGAGMIGGIAKA